MTTLGKRLIQSAKEARKIARGEADAKSYKMHIPAEIDVRAVRVRLKMTQGEFAVRYGLTLARKSGTGNRAARHRIVLHGLT